MTSRVLLTGAAGFLGSHLTDVLLARGFEVIGVDDLSTGRRENLAHLAQEPRFTFLEGDASQPLDVEGRLAWVLHFASPASPPKYLARPIETMRVNAEGTRHLLDLARAKGASFFLASTSETYGDPLEHPQRESYWGHVNPVGPRSVYDESKRYAEALTTAYHAAHGVDVRIVRIFNTYGPRMDADDGRVVTNFIKQALAGEPLTIYGAGGQTRSFCYVSDLVEGILRNMERGDAKPVNLGNPNEFTILELATLVLKLTGSTSKLEHRPLPTDDPQQRKPDIARAKTLLGWEPTILLQEGLRRTIASSERAPRPARST